VACRSWQRTYPGRGACRRCRHEGHLNTDGLCRGCLQAIRTHDLDWLLQPTPGGRPTQLLLLLPGLAMTHAQPLDKRTDRSHQPTRPPRWLEQVHAATSARPADDPRVCPPAVRGQQALFRWPRQLTDAHAQRISGRDLRDWPQVQDVAVAYAAEQHYSPSWRCWVCRMLRLALAMRDADGDDLVREEALDDLPRFADAAAEILRRAGQLCRRRDRCAAGTTSQLQSCENCGSWGFRALCQGCRQWTRAHPTGTCRRCRRAGLPVGDGLCRGCRVHVAEHGPQALTGPWTQLWFGGTLPRRRRAASRSPVHRPSDRARSQLQTQRPARPVSPHLVDPNQSTLFAMRRDWSGIDTRALPALTPTAQQLLEEFKQRSRTQAWAKGIRGQATRALHLLLAWLGAQAPIPEADIRSVATGRRWTSSRRVLRFLEEHDLVISDPARQVDVHQAAIKQRLQTLPDPIAGELGRWVQVLRGQGRRQHRPMAFATIRKYVGSADPVVRAWATRVSSLREITPDDIHAALHELQGNQARSVHVALRSLFQALKQERLVFRDPTRGICVAAVQRLPAPLPADRLRGLLDQADGAMARLVVALVAIHALRKTELTQLRLADLDLARGRLAVHRSVGRHIVYLDQLTHRLAVAWLRERRQRWPDTSSPYLLVSQQSAVDSAHPPVTLPVIDRCFWPLGVSPSQLRQDRILDEARHTADPVRLMRVFGLCDTTAMKYLYTAHPERQSMPSR
jgi:site-specific recombinase XerD